MTLDRAAAGTVFEVVAGLLGELAGDPRVLGFAITPETTFHEDLGLESIDLVTFAGILAEHFGPGVNLAEYLAEQELDEVIGLTVGELARFVAQRSGPCPR